MWTEGERRGARTDGMLTDQFLRLFEYEALCTPRVTDALRRADAAVRESGLAALAPPLERAIEIFAHIQAAKQLWLSRVSDLATFPEDGVFPVWALEKSERIATEMDKLWSAFVARQTTQTLDAPVPYTSTEGVKYESTLSDILTHVVNHGTYHRGQIALLIAQSGSKPTPTDFVALTRRQV